MNKLLKIIYFILPAFIFILLTMNTYSQNLEDLFPEETEGYKATEPVNYYTPENLFEYINGGAELFISYNFGKVLSRTYERAGEPKIVVEIFDMGEAKNAFGVFSHGREVLDETYGQGSETYVGAILFWKDRFYVSIVTDEETEVSKKAIHMMAAGIDKLIPAEGELPDILNWIPEEELVPESVFYFHHYVWMNAFYYIAGDNFLAIDESADAILAKYGPPESRYYLMMVKYETDERATSAYESFLADYAPELEGNIAVKLEDGKWTGSQVNDKLLICVFNASEKEELEELISNATAKYLKQKSKNYN